MFFSKFSVHLPKLLSIPARLSGDYYGCMPENLVTTLIGAATSIGRVTSLLLKQNACIDELRLYDTSKDACGVALELSHIDTNTKVKGYSGHEVLPDAIKGAHIIVVCSGKQQTSAEESQLELFQKNAPIIHNLAIHAAEFNPKAVFCLATPPINALVPLVSEEYKKANVYDPRKIIGITTLAGVRANTFIGQRSDVDPDCVTCPVIGGFSPLSVVPVLSQTQPCDIPMCDCKDIQEEIRYAEEDTLKHYKHKNGLVLSPAFAINRFVTALARALKGDNRSVVCCYVRQTGHIEEFLKYMMSIVKLGRGGVDSTHMPKINAQECVQLQEAAEHVRNSIKLGEAYITGEVADLKQMVVEMEKPCDLIKVKEPEVEELKQPEEQKKAKPEEKKKAKPEEKRRKKRKEMAPPQPTPRKLYNK